MPKSMERARRVKKEREARAWPQRQLADATKLNIRTIQRLERDGTASLETIMAVAGAFNMDVKDLNPTSRNSSPTKNIALQKKVYLMPRLISGKSITDVVVEAEQFQFEHDDDHDSRSIAAMKDILKLLQGDVVRLYDADPIERLNVESELSQEIKGLESCGYYLFGIKRVIPKIIGKEKSQVTMCTIFMSHSRSPKIVRDRNSNMMMPAVLTEIAR